MTTASNVVNLHEPSPHQKAIFEDVATGTGHTMISAVPGSGKTTTILWALSHLPTGARTLLLAFSKRIVDELKNRVPKDRDITVCSLNSLGNRACSKHIARNLNVTTEKVSLIVGELLQAQLPSYLLRLRDAARAESNPEDRMLALESYTNEHRYYLRTAEKTVGLCKATLSMKADEIAAMIEDRDITVPGEGTSDDAAEFIRIVRRTLEICYEERAFSIDYDDQIWLPVVMKMKVQQFTHIFIDETQDLNLAQIRLVLASLAPGGRIFAVGDPRQAIFAFRGADHRAMARVCEELSAKTLPLSVCYRCAKSIVRVAKSVVHEIEAAPSAPEGIVRTTNQERMLGELRAGDFVLSRTNAPLTALCMELLREKRPAMIVGVDIGDRFLSLIRRSKARKVDELEAWIGAWCKKECDRLEAKGRDTKQVQDTAACILTLCEGAEKLSEVLSRIKTMFTDTDENAKIVLSSTHRAKGLEKDRAFMLRWTYMRETSDGEKQSAAARLEEENLFYVAVTRARKELVLVEEH